MRFLVEILHPAHVHFFRPFIEEMARRGHDFLILSRDKDVTLPLLDAWGIDHICTSRQNVGRIGLGRELLVRAAALVRHAARFDPDVMIGLMGPSLALARPVARRPAVVFYDNESTARLNALVARICDAWVSPRAYSLNHGRRHLRYDGYHELAYLHPSRFRADPDRLRRADLDPAIPFSLVRFVGWQSIHDRRGDGLSLAGKREIVHRLAETGRVLISSEAVLPPDLEAFRLTVPVEDIHHVIAHAQLVVGESSTMASEAACLGTPAVFVSRTGRGVNDEQDQRFGMVRTFNGGREDDALAYVAAAAADRHFKDRFAANHRRLLAETIDVTGFMVQLLESDTFAATRNDVAVPLSQLR